MAGQCLKHHSSIPDNKIDKYVTYYNSAMNINIKHIFTMAKIEVISKWSTTDYIL